VATRRKHSGAGAPHGREDILYGISPVEGALRAGRRRLGRLHLKSGRLSPRLAVLRGLAARRGSEVGYQAAEVFTVVRELC